MTKDRRKRYSKKPTLFVIAVQLDLETEGFTYRKWGDEQTCKAGDWLVWNPAAEDTYTIDRDSFADTYAQIGEGRYSKTGVVWAEVAQSAGTIETREGSTAYEVGDYICYNDAAGTDGYALSAEKFEAMYEALPNKD